MYDRTSLQRGVLDPVITRAFRFQLAALFSLLAIALFSNLASAQSTPQSRLDSTRRVTVGDSRGKDFWVCFPQNARSENGSVFTPKLFITGERDTKVEVVMPGIGFDRKLDLRAQEIKIVDIDSIAQIFGSDRSQALGIHVMADNDVAVFGLSTRRASTDTYLALPTNVLGTTYRAIGYYPPTNVDNLFVSQFDIVATQDHTSLLITLTADTRGGHRKGETFSVELQKGDVYQMQGSADLHRSGDLTGSLITSDKPVAFFVGHSCAQIPPDVSFCNHLIEEEPPIPSWGRQFYVSRYKDKQQYVIRVMASEDNTEVFVNNRLVGKYKAGEFYEDNHAVENALVTASKPVLVTEFAQSSTADSIQVGDPMMMLITPTEQFLKYYRFLTPIQGEWHHYINLVVPIDAIPSLRVDGLRVPDRIFQTIGLSKYAIAQYEIGFGTHWASCDQPFGLYSYGFGVGADNFDSYGTDGGQLVQTVPLVADTLRPALELISTNGDAGLYMIARDDRLFDMGLASITIIDSSNFQSPIRVPKFDAGTPQIALTYHIRDTSVCGFMSLKLVDAAKNESYWVICRTRDNSTGRWMYTLTEGRENICPACRSWTVQFIATPAFTVSDVTFDKPNWLKGSGTFNNFSSRLSGGFGAMYVFPFNKQITLAGGIGYANFTGAAIAQHTSFLPDSILYGDTIGARYSKAIEQFTVESSVSYLTLNGGVYYYFVPEKVYTFFGFEAGFLVQNSFIETSDLLYPASIEYAQGRSGGTRELTLASGSLPFPTRFLLALELSPGVQFKLSQNVSLLAGAYMNLPFFDALQDINWHLTTFGARIGLQYRH
jgi:hypothetical protein